MNEPARKRRRTTPPENRERLSSPLKKPPRRPSFASPTKASLSRFNPDLLPSKTSNSIRPTIGGEIISHGKQVLQYILSDATEQPTGNGQSIQEADEEEQASGAAEELNPFKPMNVIARSPRQGRSSPALVEEQDAFAPRNAIPRSPRRARTPPALAEEQDRFAPRSAIPRSPSRAHTPPILAEEQDVFAPRSAIPRSPRRARTPPALAEEQDMFAPRSALSRSLGQASTPLGDLDETDFDLPSTSPLRDLAPPDTPRRGALFSSPSKRPPLLSDDIKQSPVKPIAQLLRRKGENARPLDGPSLDSQPQETKERTRQPPLDPELEKRKQEKDRLMRELEQLEHDVTRCTQEIDKLANRALENALEASERDTMVAFVNQICSLGAVEDEQAPTVSSLLCSFLPFSAQLVPLPRPQTTLHKPVLSHRPLELEDPLPCLKLFTSLNLTSQISLVGAEESSRVHQKHTISITDPQKLLAASVVATVDSTTSNVIGLSVHLPSWAEQDLGNFTRLKAQENDLSTSCWAIESYWELSKKRAEFWHKCESAFAHLKPGRMFEDTENLEEQPIQKPTQDLSRKDLRRHLGQDSLILEDKYVLLKINWRVTFDWTGEAESAISISPALPALWSETDSNDSFKKIPETFEALLRKKSVFEATRTMVALLMEGS